jgi:hypothetical protein
MTDILMIYHWSKAYQVLEDYFNKIIDDNIQLSYDKMRDISVHFVNFKLGLMHTDNWSIDDIYSLYFRMCSVANKEYCNDVVRKYLCDEIMNSDDVSKTLESFANIPEFEEWIKSYVTLEQLEEMLEDDYSHESDQEVFDLIKNIWIEDY